jgi:hypothetical protein
LFIPDDHPNITVGRIGVWNRQGEPVRRANGSWELPSYGGWFRTAGAMEIPGQELVHSVADVHHGGGVEHPFGEDFTLS